MRDLHFVIKDSAGGKPLRQSKYTFRKIADVLPGIFKSTSKNGTQVCGVAKATYDFAVHGGAAAAVIELMPGDELIPAKAVITNCFFDVITTGTGAGSIAFGATTGVDLKAATAATAYGAGTDLVGIPILATMSTHIHVATACNITATISVGTITAGKITCFVYYVISE